MTKNVGKIDKIARIAIGIVIILLGIISGSWLGIIGIVPLATGIIGWCPLYCPLKINTCGKDDGCDVSKDS